MANFLLSDIFFFLFEIATSVWNLDAFTQYKFRGEKVQIESTSAIIRLTNIGFMFSKKNNRRGSHRVIFTGFYFIFNVLSGLLDHQLLLKYKRTINPQSRRCTDKWKKLWTSDIGGLTFFERCVLTLNQYPGFKI